MSKFMSKFVLVGALAAIIASGSNLASANAESPMKKIAKSLIDTYKLPAGVTAKEIQKPNLAGTSFENRLNALTRQKVKDWRKLVLYSADYSSLSAEEKAAAIKDPKKYLEVPFLIQIETVTAYYQDGKLVGYLFETADHVQAAIYQDGAGINFYVDDAFKVVAEDEWSA